MDWQIHTGSSEIIGSIAQASHSPGKVPVTVCGPQGSLPGVQGEEGTYTTHQVTGSLQLCPVNSHVGSAAGIHSHLGVRSPRTRAGNAPPEQRGAMDRDAGHSVDGALPFDSAQCSSPVLVPTRQQARKGKARRVIPTPSAARLQSQSTLQPIIPHIEPLPKQATTSTLPGCPPRAFPHPLHGHVPSRAGGALQTPGDSLPQLHAQPSHPHPLLLTED